MRTFENHLDVRIKHSSETLKSKAEMLRDTMDYLIKRIEKGDIRGINSLGEVQGLGREVDIHCMEVRTLMYALEDFKAFEELKETK